MFLGAHLFCKTLVEDTEGGTVRICAITCFCKFGHNLRIIDKRRIKVYTFAMVSLLALDNFERQSYRNSRKKSLQQKPEI